MEGGHTKMYAHTLTSKRAAAPLNPAKPLDTQRPYRWTHTDPLVDLHLDTQLDTHFAIIRQSCRHALIGTDKAGKLSAHKPELRQFDRPNNQGIFGVSIGVS